MTVFRRKKERNADGAFDGIDSYDVDGHDTGDDMAGDESGDNPAAGLAATSSQAGGPWDIADLPDDGVNRLDLGGLHVPVLDGVEVRIDVDQTSGALISATLATPTSVMQLLAFAAPKSSGIWDEVRAEIVESIQGGGGRADVVEGPFGPQIVADVPGEEPGQLMPTRFYGVDGARWFLRALVQGQAASTPSAEPLLLQAFGLVAVVRGDEAMAVRDALVLRLPKELGVPNESESEGGTAESGTPSSPPLSLPTRGPEITETR